MGGFPEHVLWRRLDTSGLEWCRVTPGAIAGSAIVLEERLPWRIDYEIELDDWVTRQVRVVAKAPARDIRIDLSADGAGRWQRDNKPLIDVPGTIDVDLGFSPVTNTLPIRRLGLAVGQSRNVSVAWIQFPSFEIVLGRQRYTRLADRRWRYESAGFAAELEVDEEGVVERYGELWEAIRAG